MWKKKKSMICCFFLDWDFSSFFASFNIRLFSIYRRYFNFRSVKSVVSKSNKNVLQKIFPEIVLKTKCG